VAWNYPHRPLKLSVYNVGNKKIGSAYVDTNTINKGKRDEIIKICY